MLSPDDRARLDERLIVWKGAPPVDVVANPDSLREFVAALVERLGGDIGTVIIDSLKDLAHALDEGKVGSAVSNALARLSDVGVQVLALHHPRKAIQQASAGGGGKLSTHSGKLKTIDDVYGSTWLTSGSGSVLALNGKPGASIVELTTLKPIADDVGPFDVVFDHQAGAMRARGDDVTLEALVAAGNDGRTKKEAANALDVGDDRGAAEKAGRELDRLVEAGLADREPGGNRFPTKWFATEAGRARVTRNVHDLRDGVTTRDQITGDHTSSEFGSTPGHGWSHGTDASSLPYRGGRDVHRELVNTGSSDDPIDTDDDAHADDEQTSNGDGPIGGAA